MNIDKDIERCKELIKTEHSNWIGMSNQDAIENLLSELETKDKMIDLMAEFIYNTTDYEDEKIFNFKNEQEVKEYFREEEKDE